MSGDLVAGALVNMGAHGDSPEDAYSAVARVAMHALTTSEEPTAKWWLRRGIGRDVAKAIVMPLPYGLSKSGAVEAVRRKLTASISMGGHMDGLSLTEVNAAAKVAAYAVWEGVYTIFPDVMATRGRLTQYAKGLVQAPDFEGVMSWDTPSGFRAAQSYFVQQIARVPTAFHGVQRIRVATDSPEPDRTKAVAAFAPNFVHSMDAAHMHLTMSATSHSIGAIHDSFCTTANNAPTLAKTLREKFVGMYGESPLTRLPGMKTVDVPFEPPVGVLNNPFFFS
jgi:DNA-directed RNA polymerase